MAAWNSSADAAPFSRGSLHRSSRTESSLTRRSTGACRWRWLKRLHSHPRQSILSTSTSRLPAYSSISFGNRCSSGGDVARAVLEGSRLAIAAWKFNRAREAAAASPTPPQADGTSTACTSQSNDDASCPSKPKGAAALLTPSPSPILSATHEWRGSQ
eukprot:5523538-Prymnesium_polylepis.1